MGEALGRLGRLACRVDVVHRARHPAALLRLPGAGCPLASSQAPVGADGLLAV